MNFVSNTWKVNILIINLPSSETTPDHKIYPNNTIKYTNSILIIITSQIVF
jgi:hypothetical protein